MYPTRDEPHIHLYILSHGLDSGNPPPPPPSDNIYPPRQPYILLTPLFSYIPQTNVVVVGVAVGQGVEVGGRGGVVAIGSRDYRTVVVAVGLVGVGLVVVVLVGIMEQGR